MDASQYMSGATTKDVPSTSSSARYKCKKLLGKGAYANVYLAVDESCGNNVAIKVIKDVKHNSIVQYEHYIAKNLNHPNVVKTHTCMKTQGQKLMLVQDFVQNGELFDFIEKNHGLDEFSAKSVFNDLLHALEYIHGTGIIHRDIKPENILIDAHGHARVCDFGMAEPFGKFIPRGPGTVPYQSPECFNPRGHTADASMDVWSLGIVLYIMLVGDFPWMAARADDPEFAAYLSGRLQTTKNWMKLTPRIKELLSRMLAVNPADRCQLSECRAYFSDDWLENATKTHVVIPLQRTLSIGSSVISSASTSSLETMSDDNISMDIN